MLKSLFTSQAVSLSFVVSFLLDFFRINSKFIPLLWFFRFLFLFFDCVWPSWNQIDFNLFLMLLRQCQKRYENLTLHFRKLKNLSCENPKKSIKWQKIWSWLRMTLFLEYIFYFNYSHIHEWTETPCTQ
jgi:hypothetical protein